MDIRHFPEFAWAVINNWAALVTGGLVIALITFWSWLKAKPMPKKLGIVLAIFFLLMAFFKAWEDKKTQVDKLNSDLISERDKNTVKLGGEILLLHGMLSSNKKDVGIMLHVRIWNLGADSAIIGYRAEATFNDEVLDLHPMVLPDNGITIDDDKGNPVRTFTSADALEHKTISPVKKGDSKMGVLFFVIRDGIRFKNIYPKWDLFFADYLGKEYKIHFEPVKKIEGFKAYPGALGLQPKCKPR